MSKQSNTNPKIKLSDSAAKLVAVGGIALMAFVATVPTGGSTWGHVVTVGSILLDPIIWCVVAIISVVILFKRK
jgi:uncharacterized membrane protein